MLRKNYKEGMSCKYELSETENILTVMAIFNRKYNINGTLIASFLNKNF